MGAAWLLPRIVGYGLATEILMTGDFVDPKRAYEIGLYNRVVPQAQVLVEARAVAEKLARGPSEALGITKQALEGEAALDLETALAYEAEVQAQLMQGPNFREAHEAFTAKRDPKFI
jgi:2-(1,2-epoxy-1,2-dihydrophenyl)acetyl-CoA isomerase